MIAAVERLSLNDSSLSITRDQSASLGLGLRCGFLGFLHMEVFNQRLFDEFDMGVVITTPSVPYLLEKADGSTSTISCVTDWPEITGGQKSKGFSVYEPIVKVNHPNHSLYDL
jgi:GTP-binding protein LepA